jgi:uncharacterized protein (TIGR02145 family)
LSESKFTRTAFGGTPRPYGHPSKRGEFYIRKSCKSHNQENHGSDRRISPNNNGGYMKRVKTTLAAILAVAIAFTFNACGDDGGGGGGEDSSSSGTATGISSSDGLSSSGGGSSSSSEILESSSSVEMSSSSSKHEHAWGEWEETAQATCEAASVETRACKGDSTHKETREGASPQLKWEWTVTIPATCEAAGEEIGTCPGNASPPQTWKIRQRTWNEVITPPTPTSAGVITRTCPGGVPPPQTITMKCGGYDPDEQFCDERDEKLYKYVDINGQVWMAENLNYNAPDSRCYGDNTGGDSQNRCGTYGRLYDWAAAMGLASSCNSSACNSQIQSKHKGVCPSGWHISNADDWNALIAFVHSDNGLGSFTSGNSIYAGKYLKATSSWNSYSGIVNLDSYGFSALPGGYGLSSGGFGTVGIYGFWWSASEYNSDYAYNRGMTYDNESANYNANGKDQLFSVRCVRD